MSRNLKPAVHTGDHFQGPADAPVELVEYGDYQCPHCGRAYPIIKRIQEKLGKDLKFVFRNFPLSEAHPQAFMAAVATEAADKQHKFWEMHDILFERQENLDLESIVSYAVHMGLNDKTFIKDLEDEKLSAKVEADFESGIHSGVNGTPTFFINGVRFDGSWDEQHLLAQLQGVLKGR
jgi:protein-disulfide isomerase